MEGIRESEKRDPSIYDNLSKQTYKLIVPVEFGGSTYTELVFREPIADDLWNVSGNGKDTIGDLLSVGAKLANVPQGVMRRLRGQDTFMVKTILLGFFLGGVETEGLN